MKLSHIAFAIAATVGSGVASAQLLTINGGGASATRNAIRDAVVGSICGATSINIYESGTNVRRITCPTTRYTGFTDLDFSYDNTEGSYLGIGPVSGTDGTTTTATGAGEVRNVLTTGCGTSAPATVAGKSVTVFPTCPAGPNVQAIIGNADVEPSLFRGVNLPAGVPAPNLANITSIGQFAVIFGIAVSDELYRALQADQGLTVTPSGTVLTEGPNTPSLTKVQVTGLSTANGGVLNADWRGLFAQWDYVTDTHPVLTSAEETLARETVKWERRVAGSGSQAAFNAYFLSNPCSPNGATPATALDSVPGGYTVTESGSSGGVSGNISGAVNFRAGLLSRETPPSATLGFVKIDGFAPVKADARQGRYSWVVEQVLTIRNSANTGAVATFFSDLATATGAGDANAAVMALPGIADPLASTYAANSWKHRNFNNSCAPAARFEN